MWTQPELFNWNDPDVFIKPKRKKRVIDYDALYQLFLQGPVRFSDIEQVTGMKHNAIAQVITSLSLRYPIYELKRGVYKLYGDDDYGDGINKSLIKKDEDE